jgi:malate dehydrogenase (oxaloacetate-decarboxylating)(NADP+)
VSPARTGGDWRREHCAADLFDFQKPPAHPNAPSRDFVEVIKPIKPTAIIGVGTRGKASTRELVEAMADLTNGPVIFPVPVRPPEQRRPR